MQSPVPKVLFRVFPIRVVWPIVRWVGQSRWTACLVVAGDRQPELFQSGVPAFVHARPDMAPDEDQYDESAQEQFPFHEGPQTQWEE